MTIFDEIRASCAAVAAVSTHVSINPDAIEKFAATLDLDVAKNDPGQERMGSEETGTAFIMALDAINFGSGYFPYIQKRPRMSGYHTVASSLRDLVADTGPITTARLAAWTVDDAAATFGQVLDGGPAHELMTLFTEAWHDLAAFVDRVGDGSFAAAVETAAGSADALVRLLAEMPFFHDVHTHPATGEVLLYKRAQIVVQDLHVVFEGKGPGQFDDHRDLTMFPDNLVPHVLRVEGILEFDTGLLRRIEAVEDIPVGSPEEIEIRACGLHAVDLLRDSLRERGDRTTSGDLDNVLWNLGAAPRYKNIPRHRSRCVFY